MASIDIEKGTTTPSSVPLQSNRKTNHRVANISMSIPILIAYIGLFTTNYYMSPNGPASESRNGDSGRINPLAIVLMLLGAELVQKAFAITTTTCKNESPCFGFGWLAYSLSLLVSVACGSGDLSPKPECDVKVLDMKTGKSRSNRQFAVSRLLRDLESRSVPSNIDGKFGQDNEVVVEILQPTGISSSCTSFANLLQSGSLITALLQFCVAGSFWYYYDDLSPLLLLSISILLIEATAGLPVWNAQITSSMAGGTRTGAYALMRDTDSPPNHIYIVQSSPTASTSTIHTPTSHPTNVSAASPCIPLTILTTGAFLSQALLYTQLSDNAAIAMLLIMFCGTMSNLVIIAMPRVPQVDGVKLRSVSVMEGEGNVVNVLKEVEARFEGYEDVLIRQFFPEMIGKWEGGMEKGGMGEMD